MHDGFCCVAVLKYVECNNCPEVEMPKIAKKSECRRSLRACVLGRAALIAVAPFVFAACGDDTVAIDPAGNDNHVAPTPDSPEDEKTPGACADECNTEGDLRCDAQGEYVCGYFDDDPCLEWSDPSPCPGGCRGNACACVSECPKNGDIACDSTIGYMFCQDDDGDGCLRWSTTTFCGPGEVCDAVRGGCKPDNPQICANACAPGSKDCLGNGRRECKDINGDGCAEWSDPVDCGSLACSGGSCADAAETCADECVLNSRDCAENGWRECKDANGDGCAEWSPATPCGALQKCDAGACVPACADACENGKKRCSGSNVQTCADANGDGCAEWTGDAPCEFGCDSGVCKENPNAWVPSCSGANCPIVVTDFKQTISGNTANGTNIISAYGGNCSATDESGPEQRYIFKIDEPGTVIIGTTEPSGGDVDVHLLKGLNASDCLARGDKGLSYHVPAGIYYAVADTYKSASNAGSYKLKITFLPDSGKCGLETGIMNRINTPKELQMPATGRVVQEAHMVTDHDQSIHGSGWWPSTGSEGIAEHLAYSSQWTGIQYGKDWCPAGEGGCQYGQGATGKAVPWKAEAYYVCMYWTAKSKPKPGTRFLVVNPVTGKAVVTAAGYETGPGDGDKIGGAVYEIHQKLGTTHNSTLTFGQMRSQGQSLEYGPIDCD